MYLVSVDVDVVRVAALPCQQRRVFAPGYGLTDTELHGREIIVTVQDVHRRPPLGVGCRRCQSGDTDASARGRLGNPMGVSNGAKGWPAAGDNGFTPGPELRAGRPELP